MNQSSFAVTRFQNRNGVISWRVDGRLHGVRIRKNFKTREEAIAEKATQELKALQADAGLQSTTTFLSEEQLREAETAAGPAPLRCRGGAPPARPAREAGRPIRNRKLNTRRRPHTLR